MRSDKGLTYEQKYGEKKAKIIKDKLSKAGKKPNKGQFKKGDSPWIKGKHHKKKSIKQANKHRTEWYKNPSNRKKIEKLRKNQSI